MEHAASDRDLELGQGSIVVKNESKSQPGHGWQNFNALNEPRLPVVKPHSIETTKRTGPPFADKDGIIRNLPRSIAEAAGMDKDLWEKFNSGRPAYMREFIAEYDRMLSGLCLHHEQRSAHNQIGSRMIYRMQRLVTFHFLFVSVMSYAYFAGYVDFQPRSLASYVMGAEIGWYIPRILLKIWELYKLDKRRPGEFCFKLDFQNLPALKELAGEQEWKDMQECSDYIRVLDDLKDIVFLRQSQT